MATAEPANIRIPLEPWEVGGELLDILSRGLYSDAKDAIREYVQNGIDAGARSITISANGPLVSVRDDGSGMDWDGIRKARRFGMSEKTPLTTVGYRGIGLYSAFGMCETLTLTTRRARMRERLTLSFQFGPMRRILESDKSASKRSGISLADLLHQHTQFAREPYNGPKDDHFTLVRLEGVTPEYRPQLSDPQALQNYLLNTVPVAFPREGYGATVNPWLKRHADLNPVRLSIRVGDEAETKIQPSVAKGVGDPEQYWLKGADGTRLAFIWHALTTTKYQIGNGAAPVSGFLLKMKGFTLGDRLTVKHLWPPKGGRTLYHHYTGEIHVLEGARVYPNASRDDLEPGPQKQVFTRYLEDYFSVLNAGADRARQIISVEDRLSNLDSTLGTLRDHLKNPEFDQFELYRQSKNLSAELDRAEKDLQKIQRLKKPGPATEEQQNVVKRLLERARSRKREVDAIVQLANKETTRATNESRTQTTKAPPQAALLDRAYKAVAEMSSRQKKPQIAQALRELETARRLVLVPRAISVLDSLRVSGIPLSAKAESSRRDLRALIGWSPLAPLSLEEALVEEGVALLSTREEVLVACIDRGIISGVGGRGEAYESIIQSIAANAAEEEELH